MATRCFTPIFGKRIRVTRLDACGNVPVAGTASSYVATDGFVSVNLSAEVEDGNEIITRKADGSICVNERQSSSFKRFNVEMEFCGVNPDLLSLTTNAEQYKDVSDTLGIVVPEGTIDKKFGFELWTGLSGQACEPGVEEASGYLLLPFVNAGVIGDLSIDGENAVSFSMTGAFTRGGNAWGVGPFKVIAGGAGANEVQTVTITGTPTGGSFTLTWPGIGTTAPIAYNAVNSAVQTALLALGGVETGDVVVTGGPGPGTPYVLTFGGGWANKDVLQLTATGAFTGGTNPAVAVTTTTPGSSGTGLPIPTTLDPLDHLLLIETDLAPPPSACAIQSMPL